MKYLANLNPFSSVIRSFPVSEENGLLLGVKNDFHIILNSYIIHQSWARDEKEILKKINNWGHKNDFDTKNFFDIWKNLNENNCPSLQNFHPLNPTDWKSVKFVKAENIEDNLILFLNLL